MPLFLWKNRNFVVLTLVATVGCLVFYALNIIWSTQITTIYGKSPEAAGWITVSTPGRVLNGIS